MIYKMKRIFTGLLLLLLMGTAGQAATTMVNVEDFEFDPASITVNVGDTVLWLWNNGFHTTTSTTIPSGATSWNQPIDQSHLMFSYVPAVAGSYDYICIYHSSMGMTGHITVAGTTGITGQPSLSFLSVHEDASARELRVTCNIPVSGSIALRMYDIIGKPVYTKNAVVASGEQEHILSTASLHSGIYIVEIAASGTKVSRKIMIH
jgi:plastocyanin